MNKKLIYIALFVAAIFTACSKEDDLTPSGLDINWYELSDSDDPIDHLRYQIYQEFGVSTFVTDTIGSQERGKDVNGEKIIYYEVLDPNYAITSNEANIKFNKSENDEDILATLSFLKDEVFPNLPKQLYPRCYMVVESLFPYSKNYSTRSTEEYVAKGMMTSVVGHSDEFATMDRETKDKIKTIILAEEYAGYLIKNCDDLLKDFYAYSIVLSVDEDYEYDLYKPKDFDLGYWNSWGYNEADVEPLLWNEFGFISYYRGDKYEYKNEDDWEYTCPTKSVDVAAYVAEVLQGNEEEFKTTYADYPIMLDKFDIMKRVLDSLHKEFAK